MPVSLFYDLSMRAPVTYIATPRRELLGHEIRKGALHLAERMRAHVEINMRLYGAAQCPTCGPINEYLQCVPVK